MIARLLMQKILRRPRPAVLRREPCGRRRQSRHRGRRARDPGWLYHPRRQLELHDQSGALPKIPYDPYNDFDPVTEIATTPNVLVVHPSVPAKTVRELIDFVRASSGKSSYANPGTGTPSHLSGEMFKLAVKIDMVAVPFQGGGPMIQSVLGNHTPIAFSSMPPAAPQIRAGGNPRARCDQRQAQRRGPGRCRRWRRPAWPDQEGDTPQGILVPKGAPREVIDLLYRETVKVIALPDVQQKLAAIGFEPIGGTPEEFTARIRTMKCRNGRRSSATPTSNRNDERVRACYYPAKGDFRDGLPMILVCVLTGARGRSPRRYVRHGAGFGGGRLAGRAVAHRPDARNRRRDRPTAKRHALPHAGSGRRSRYDIQPRQPHHHQYELRAGRA